MKIGHSMLHMLCIETYVKWWDTYDKCDLCVTLCHTLLHIGTQHCDTIVTPIVI
jgi:hypothetical protein